MVSSTRAAGIGQTAGPNRSRVSTDRSKFGYGPAMLDSICYTSNIGEKFLLARPSIYADAEKVDVIDSSTQKSTKRSPPRKVL
jgi:hypothetical protein